MTPLHLSVPASQTSQNIMPLSNHPLFVHKSVLLGLGQLVSCQQYFVWPQKSVALMRGRVASTCLGLQMAETAQVVASSPSLTTLCRILKKAYPGALRDPRGLEKKLQRSFQTETQDTAQRHVGLILLVKVNLKFGPDSRGGNRLHLCMERVRRGARVQGWEKSLRLSLQIIHCIYQDLIEFFLIPWAFLGIDTVYAVGILCSRRRKLFSF